MIQGNKFKDLTQWHYAPARIYTGDSSLDALNNMPLNDYRYLKNTVYLSTIPEGDIIYTHTFYADQLFERLKHPAIVITHNADTPADIIPPKNVIRWYSTNVNITDERVTSIPLGIENDFWLKDKKAVMLRKSAQPKKYKNLIYINHNVKTNANRKIPYDVLAGKSWATIRQGANGIGFDAYIDSVHNHPFVVAPEGNGLDTHRVWECLYMRTIPVVLRNINNAFYTDLPILFLDSWEELTEKFLFDKFMEFSRKEWNMEKLNFEYWKKLILGR